MANVKKDKTNDEKEFLKMLGNQIKSKRQEVGMTQYELAFKANVADNMVGQIERAESVASIITLYRICKILEIEIKI